MIYDENEVLAEGYKAISGKAFHTSDCATSCAPAYRPNPCDCDGPSLWRPYEDRPRDATVLVTVVPGPAHSYPDKIKPTTHPAYIDEEGRICDCSTWAPDKGLHGSHWVTVAWMPLPDPASGMEAATAGETGNTGSTEGDSPVPERQTPKTQTNTPGSKEDAR